MNMTILLIGSWACLAGATALGDLAARMKAGEWQELVTTGLTKEFLETSGNNAANHSILQYAAKAMWDPATEQFFFLGSPHDNPYKFIIYSAAGNSWKLGPLPDACMNLGHYSGGCSVHSYYYMAGLENGKFYTYTGAGGGKVYSYDIAANSWTAVSGNPIPMYGPVYGSCAYSPERQGFIYACGNVGVWFCPKATGAWSEVTAPSGMSWGYYHVFAHYNPVHHDILFGGGGGLSGVYKIAGTGSMTITPMASAPFPIGTNAGNIAIDPVSGNYIACTGTQMSEFNSETNQWTSLSSLPPQEIRWAFPTDIAAASVSNYGVIMYLTHTPAKVHLYKHTAGAGTAGNTHASSPEQGITAAPNPFSVSTAIGMPQNAAYSIYNISGRLVEKGVCGSGSFTWRPQRLPGGVYLLKARSGDRISEKTLLLRK